MWPHLCETLCEANEDEKATRTPQISVGVIVGLDCHAACRSLFPQALKRLHLQPPSPPPPPAPVSGKSAASQARGHGFALPKGWSPVGEVTSRCGLEKRRLRMLSPAFPGSARPCCVRSALTKPLAALRVNRSTPVALIHRSGPDVAPFGTQGGFAADIRNPHTAHTKTRFDAGNALLRGLILVRRVLGMITLGARRS